MRKIILNLAMSLDGFIADNEGGFAWIKGQGDRKLDTKNQFSFQEFLDEIDTIVMGSKAYEDCKAYMDDYGQKAIYVASSRPLSLPSSYHRIEGDLVSQILELKNKPGKNIWLFGGGEMLDAFIRSACVDEYIVGIIPTLLGQGRPLFLGHPTEQPLCLKDYYLDDGVMIFRYIPRL